MATGKVDDIFEKNFMTSAKFSVEIEKIVKEGDLNYIEAIVQFCEDKNIEMDGISKLISKPLKEKLKCDWHGGIQDVSLLEIAFHVGYVRLLQIWYCCKSIEAII